MTENSDPQPDGKQIDTNSTAQSGLDSSYAEAAYHSKKTPHRNRFVTTLRRSAFMLLVLGIPLLLIILLPYLAWQRAPETELAVRVIDKTVPFTNRREHRGLFWLLGQNKFIDPNAEFEDRFYDYGTDYLGSHPTRNEGLINTSLLSFDKMVNYDVLYITDTYGVYSQDYSTAHDDPEKLEIMKKERSHTGRSKLLFGGLEEQEVLAIENSASFDKLIIAEFNAFASPTNSDLRHRMEKVLGVDWSEWSGRYFVNFSDTNDVPAWIYTLYEAREGRDLRAIGGSGLVLVRDESEDFIILWDGQDLKRDAIKFIPRPEFVENGVMQDVDSTLYSYWLDIVTPQADTEVLADFELNVTEAGTKKLASRGFGSRFPAVLRKKAGYTAYYLAGDMCDFGKPMGPCNTRLTLFLSRKYFSVPVKGGNGQFFWHSYYPMLTNILQDRANRLPSSGS